MLIHWIFPLFFLLKGVIHLYYIWCKLASWSPQKIYFPMTLAPLFLMASFIVGAKMSYRVWLQHLCALQEYLNNIRCHFISIHILFEKLEVVTNQPICKYLWKWNMPRDHEIHKTSTPFMVTSVTCAIVLLTLLWGQC